MSEDRLGAITFDEVLDTWDRLAPTLPQTTTWYGPWMPVGMRITGLKRAQVIKWAGQFLYPLWHELGEWVGCRALYFVKVSTGKASLPFVKDYVIEKALREEE